jgi:hypothetical protein
LFKIYYFVELCSFYKVYESCRRTSFNMAHLYKCVLSGSMCTSHISKIFCVMKYNIQHNCVLNLMVNLVYILFGYFRIIHHHYHKIICKQNWCTRKSIVWNLLLRKVLLDYNLWNIKFLNLIGSLIVVN